MEFLNLGKSVSIHPAAVFALSAGMFLLLLGLLYIPFLGMEGGRVQAWRSLDGDSSEPVDLPLLIKPDKTETYEFMTVLGPLEGQSLCFAGLDVNALSARFNGREIYRLGDREIPTGNLWNSMIVIPLPDSDEAENELVLTLTGNFYISMTRAPWLENWARAVMVSALHRTIYHDLIILFMGAALLSGIFSLLNGIWGKEGKPGDILFGLACLAIAVYGLEFTYRATSGPWPFYNVLKRIALSCGFLGSYLYLLSIDYRCNNKVRIGRFFFIPSVCSLILFFAVPDLPLLFRIFPYLNIALILQFVLTATMVIRAKSSHPLYLIPIFLIILSLVHVTFILAFKPGRPLVLPYAIVLSASMFGLQFARERHNLAQERDRLKKTYNKDALTEAFNRHVLNDLNLEAFSMAVFMDLDNFKYYNDQYGHDRGDDLLRDFVRSAEETLRQGDILIRFGGDEFLILFRDADEKEAASITERIRLKFMQETGDDKIDLSYGISPVNAKGVFDMDDLDGKMYAMKNRRKEAATG